MSINKINPLFITLVIVIVLLTLSPILSVGLIINDDIQNKMRVESLSFTQYLYENFQNWKTQGRTNFLAILWYYIPFAIDSFIYYKIVSIILLVLNLILLALFIKILTNSNLLFYICFLIGIVGLQNSWEHNPITTFSGFFSIPINLLLGSLILFLFYKTKDKKTFLYISVSLYFCTLFSYELFILYFPLFVLLSFYYNNNKIVLAIKDISLHFTSIIVYLISYGIFRLVFGSSYSGVEIQESINIIDSLRVMFQFSISSIPMYFLFNSKYQYLLSLYSDIKEYTSITTFILFNIKIVYIVKAILVFVVFFSLSQKTRVTINKKVIFIGLICSIFYIFLPTVLLAITPLYQEAVIKNGQLGMPVSFFSYLAVIITSIFILLLVNHIFKKEYSKKASIFFLGIVLSVVSIGNDILNTNISNYQSLSNEKWKIMDKFLKTNEFSLVPENAFIYAPSLWYQIGTVVVNEDYWSKYISNKTGKNITVINKQINSGDHPVYFLNYVQDFKDKNEYLVFGKSTSTYQFLSDEVYIFYYSKYNDYSIVGQVDNTIESTITLNNIQKFPVNNGLFSIKINPANLINTHGLKKSLLNSKAIKMDSIFIVNGKNQEISKIIQSDQFIGNTLETAEIINGFYPQEQNFRWIDNIAELKLINRDKFNFIIITGTVPEFFENINFRLFINERLEVERLLEKGQFTINVPINISNSTVHLKIETDKVIVPREIGLNNDYRRLSLIINDIRLE